MKKIFLLEDDLDIANFLTKKLESCSYYVEHTQDGSLGLKVLVSQYWDCVLLDRMLLNGIDGLDILKALRSIGNKTPVIVVSALGQMDERISCLKAGADDFLEKPFFFAELEARIEAVMRRTSNDFDSEILKVNDLSINLINQTVFRNEVKILLNPREFKLLVFLAKNIGEVVTRSMVFENVWGYEFNTETNVIDVHISNLRQKIDENRDQSCIKTIRGSGYCLIRA